MKRMPAEQRRSHAASTIANLEKAWTCSHGAWNRDKFLDELERQLRRNRKVSGERVVSIGV